MTDSRSIESIVAANPVWPMPIEVDGKLSNTPLTDAQMIIVDRAALLRAQRRVHDYWASENDSARKRSLSVAGRVLQELIVDREQKLREVTK